MNQHPSTRTPRFTIRVLVMLLCASTLTGCNFFVDWEEDYIILNEMHLLDGSPLWTIIYERPARDYDCAWHCQNITRTEEYRVEGDFEEAKAEAHRILSANWNVFEFEFDAAGRTIYQYKHKIETSTNTAYLLLEPYVADNVLAVTVSSAEFPPR